MGVGVGAELGPSLMRREGLASSSIWKEGWGGSGPFARRFENKGTQLYASTYIYIYIYL